MIFFVAILSSIYVITIFSFCGDDNGLFDKYVVDRK